jgi:hypothetical protein
MSITNIPVQGEITHNLCRKVRQWLLLGRGLLQKTSEAEQIVFECVVTSFLQLLVNFCNGRLFRNYQLSLRMDDDGDGMRVTT